MGKAKTQVSGKLKIRPSVKKHENLKSKPNSRARALTEQLKAFGKVGGFVDKRVGIHNESTTSADAALRRHIIEKLRQMETIGTTSADKDDPLVKAAFGGKKSGKHVSFDDDLGGLSAEIVESELFAGGLLTTVENQEPHNNTSRSNKHDALLEKIAQTKEERLRRVEENEAQRKKLKDADVEWTDKVRFMLTQLGELRPKNTKAAKKMEQSRKQVVSLLNRLSSSKIVPPVGTKIANEETRMDMLLSNLESIMARKVEAVSGEEHQFTNSVENNSKTKDALLRILCRLKTYESSTVYLVASELRHLLPTRLTEVMRGLLLVQILLTEVISRRVEAQGTGANKFDQPERLKGIFIPEVPHFLVRMLTSTSEPDSVLNITDDLSSIQGSQYNSLDIRPATGEVAPPTEPQHTYYRLGCLDRCFSLALSILNIYADTLPSPAVCHIFSGLVIDKLNLDYLPEEVRVKAKFLSEKLASLRAQPPPRDMVAVSRVTLLLADKNATPQALQRAGIVPQLEPDFDEKLDARRPKKKKSTTVELKQKLRKERRGVVRELRRDAQFLANYDRSKTKASDELRKRKTKAIIASMRSIE